MECGTSVSGGSGDFGLVAAVVDVDVLLFFTCVIACRGTSVDISGSDGHGNGSVGGGALLGAGYFLV